MEEDGQSWEEEKEILRKVVGTETTREDHSG